MGGLPHQVIDPVMTGHTAWTPPTPPLPPLPRLPGTDAVLAPAARGDRPLLAGLLPQGLEGGRPGVRRRPAGRSRIPACAELRPRVPRTGRRGRQHGGPAAGRRRRGRGGHVPGTHGHRLPRLPGRGGAHPEAGGGPVDRRGPEQVGACSRAGRVDARVEEDLSGHPQCLGWRRRLALEATTKIGARWGTPFGCFARATGACTDAILPTQHRRFMQEAGKGSILEPFIAAVEGLGTRLQFRDEKNPYFLLLRFKKQPKAAGGERPLDGQQEGAWPTLRACQYKKR